MQLIVTNKTERIIGYPVPVAPGSNVSTMARLMPGSNQVDGLPFTDFQKSMLYKHLEAEGQIEVVDAAEGFDGSLVKLDVVKAKAIVGDCVSVDTLENWLDGEKRKDVKKAISARLKTLEKVLDTTEEA